MHTETLESVGDIAANMLSGFSSETVWDGKPITKPGVYAGIPIETYHNDVNLFAGDWSISSTGLRQIIKRPLEWWDTSPFNENRRDPKTTPELNFGKAAHMLLLGESGFSEVYAPRPEWRPDDMDKPEDERRKWNANAGDCKAWLDWAEENNRTVITQTEIEKIREISDSLSRHELVRQGLLNGRIERSIVVKIDGIWIRVRPDAIPNTGGDFVDLKTAADVDDDALSKTIYDRGYHIQGALVRMAVRELFGPDAFQSFTFVFAEKTAPFDVRVKQLKDVDLDVGEKQARYGLRIMRRCIEEGRWPGYDGFGDSAGWIEMPSWARTRIENQLTLGEAA